VASTPCCLVREVEHSLSQGIDFRQEAANTPPIGARLAEFGRLTVPTVYAPDPNTTSRVLRLSGTTCST
jgi:predicted unusual protein kinase regulating ubiquinone biosynthesis (AarF/ABC1/UbiB family)